MFKKFESAESIVTTNQMKSSVQRAIRSKLVENYPNTEVYINEILPKKMNLKIVKCQDHIELISNDTEPLFFKKRDGPYYPTLRLLHMYPNMLPRVQVDKGAIKFVLSGAHIMCPGLTSAGAALPDECLPEECPVSVHAEGKEHALAIGHTKMRTDDIKTINKGIGIENVHYLNDGLWRMDL